MPHWSKKLIFECKPTLFADQTFQDFVKIALTRVSIHWLWFVSGRVIR